MKNVKEVAIAALVVIFLFVVTGFALAKWIPWCSTKDAGCNLGVTEWAYWVAAIGTVGTLIGTIWLSTMQARRIHSRDVLYARIAATQLIFKLRNAKHLIADALSNINRIKNPNFTNASVGPIVAEQIGEIYTTVEGITVCTEEDLAKIAPIDRGAIVILVRAISHVADVSSLAKKFVDKNFQATISNDAINQNIFKIISSLTDAEDRIDRAIARLTKEKISFKNVML